MTRLLPARPPLSRARRTLGRIPAGLLTALTFSVSVGVLVVASFFVVRTVLTSAAFPHPDRDPLSAVPAAEPAPDIAGVRAPRVTDAGPSDQEGALATVVGPAITPAPTPRPVAVRAPDPAGPTPAGSGRESTWSGGQGGGVVDVGYGPRPSGGGDRQDRGGGSGAWSGWTGDDGEHASGGTTGVVTATGGRTGQRHHRGPATATRRRVPWSPRPASTPRTSASPRPSSTPRPSPTPSPTGTPGDD